MYPLSKAICAPFVAWWSRPTRAVTLIVTLLVLLPNNAALAWGAQGHRVSGLVAEPFLSPRARLEVSHLLDGASLADVATWMDEEKRRLGPNIARWHYTNVSVCGPVEARCPSGNCLHERLHVLVSLLKNRSAPAAARARALRMVIHLVGDLHQTCKSTDLCSDSSVLL